jgi:Gluconate 2-dehydrogenase subunit 3
MNRRELIKRIALLTGGSVIGAEVFLAGCKNAGGTDFDFPDELIPLLDEVGETILPRTKTPGAKDAAIGQFMKTIVTDCYHPADQQIFKEGIEELKKRCLREFGKVFTGCTTEQRTALIKQIDEEAKRYNKKRLEAETIRKNRTKGTLEYFNREEMPAHWFILVKQLTLWGFFTSEAGASQALRYVPVPGRYDGDVEYKKGDRALYPCY